MARCSKGRRVQLSVQAGANVRVGRVIVQPDDPRPWAISSSPPGPADRADRPHPAGGTSVVRDFCDAVSDAARRVAIATNCLEAMEAPPASEDSETAAWTFEGVERADRLTQGGQAGAACRAGVRGGGHGAH